MVTVVGKFRFWVPFLAVVALVWAATTQLVAHNVFGLSADHKARVQSPNPSPTVDRPVPFFNTGLSVACFLITNQSTTDANITAFGLLLPGAPDESADGGFALVSPLDRGLTIQEGVAVPGFPGVNLDFAVMTGGNFTSGHHRLGIPPGGPGPTRVCVSGPFSNDPIRDSSERSIRRLQGRRGSGQRARHRHLGETAKTVILAFM